MKILDYLFRNKDKIILETWNHLFLVFVSIIIASILGILIGIFISKNKKKEKIVLKIAEIFMTIPSLALFGILVIVLSPIKMGIGKVPTIIALVIYSLMPIIRNTILAINNVRDELIEVAIGMGMSKTEILFKIKIPLTVPIIMAGVRNSAVMGIGIATIGYYIASGGLGYFIFYGLTRGSYEMVILGVIILSLMGIIVNYLFIKLEYFLTPKGIREDKK